MLPLVFGFVQHSVAKTNRVFTQVAHDAAEQVAKMVGLEQGDNMAARPLIRKGPALPFIGGAENPIVGAVKYCA